MLTLNRNVVKGSPRSSKYGTASVCTEHIGWSFTNHVVAVLTFTGVFVCVERTPGYTGPTPEHHKEGQRLRSAGWVRRRQMLERRMN